MGSDKNDRDTRPEAPEPGWPEHRAAPEALEFVRRFANTIWRPDRIDRIAEPDDLDRWLSGENRHPVSANPADHARVIGVREAIHRMTVAHRHRRPDPAAQVRLEELFGSITFHVVADPPNIHLSAGVGAGVDALLGEIALMVVDASRDNTWQRLKSCPSCDWVVYDGSEAADEAFCDLADCLFLPVASAAGET